jgi:aminomethyltransferase
VVENDGKKIGNVTSGTMSPSLGKGIGLALIEKEYIDFGTEIDINVRDRLYKARVVKKPFYKGGR